MLHETSEQALLNSVKEGDRKAMQDLYGLYSPYLYAVCSRYVTDEPTAQDILQESFIKIFNSIGKFSWRGEGSLKAWMTKIAVNEALKYLRATAVMPILRLTPISRLIPILRHNSMRLTPLPSLPLIQRPTLLPPFPHLLQLKKLM